MNQTNRNNVKQKAEGKKCSLNLTVCPFLNIGKSLLQKLQKFKFNALCLANCLPKPTSSILILRNKEGDSLLFPFILCSQANISQCIHEKLIEFQKSCTNLKGYLRNNILNTYFFVYLVLFS